MSATQRMPRVSPSPSSKSYVLSSAKLHVPIQVQLTVRNHHPTRTACISVLLESDASDSFLIAGLRNGRVPALLPGAEERLLLTLIPIECGFVKIPGIKVFDKRKAESVSPDVPSQSVEHEGELVPTIDIRYEKRGGEDVAGSSGGEKGAEGKEGLASVPAAEASVIGPILVLP